MDVQMQSLVDKLGSTATFVLGAIVFVILLLILLLALRAFFFGRVRTGGGRSRQPRLGIVDAFDLDRQRQLVLVRRDNVEHLIMIGGPNDVVVETAIVRAGEQARSRAPGEDVPATVAPAAPAPPPPAPLAVPPAAPVAPSLSQPAAPNLSAPGSVPLRSPIAAATPSPVPPPAPRITPPGGPSRLSTPPRPPGSAPIPPMRPLGAPPAPGVRSGMSAPSPAPEGGEPRRFEFGRPLSRANLEPAKPTVAPEVKPAEQKDDQTEGADEAPKLDLTPETPAPVTAPPVNPPAPAPSAEVNPLDALEEEMAKLLGRPPEKQ
jgi:hypothetical protein